MPNDRDYAIVVGIADYANYCQIQAAESDAKEFANWLKAKDGGDVPEENVALILSSDLPPQLRTGHPFKDEIDDAFIRLLGNGLLEKRADPIGRRFYFYFSGHGCAPSYSNIALIMANSANRVPNRNIGVRNYSEILAQRAHFEEIVLFLDCCRGVDDTVDAQSPPFKPPDPEVKYAHVRMMVAIGAQIGQLSNAPDSPRAQSFFTEYLLEGLRGAAAAQDNSITAKSLMDYVRPRVEAKALRHNVRQIPELEKPADIVFRKGVDSGRLVSLVIPSEWTRRIELLAGDNTLVGSSSAGEIRLQAVLRPGLYQVVYRGDLGVGQPDIRQIIRVNADKVGATIQLDPARVGEYDV